MVFASSSHVAGSHGERMRGSVLRCCLPIRPLSASPPGACGLRDTSQMIEMRMEREVQYIRKHKSGYTATDNFRILANQT